MIDLNRLLAEPERVAEIPARSVQGLIVRLSALLAALGARAGDLATDARWRDQPAAPPDKNISVEEAAGRLGVSKDWLYKNASKLPFAVRIGRRLLFSNRGLERWNHQRQGRS